MQPSQDETQALSWSDIEALLQPEVEHGTRRDIVRRLLQQAARNRREEAPLRGLFIAPETYETSIRKAVERTRRIQERLMQERRNAGRLWEILDSHPPARRRILVHNDRRFQTWGLYDCMIERVHALLEQEPEAAVEAAELAVAIAQALSPTAYGEERVHDFEGEALVALGEARRVAGDLAGAQAAFDQAAAVLALGTGDLLEKAGLASARAALLRDLGRPEEAEAAGRRAVRLAQRVGGPRDRTRHRNLDEIHPDLRRGGRFPIQAFRPRMH